MPLNFIKDRDGDYDYAMKILTMWLVISKTIWKVLYWNVCLKCM